MSNLKIKKFSSLTPTPAPDGTASNLLQNVEKPDEFFDYAEEQDGEKQIQDIINKMEELAVNSKKEGRFFACDLIMASVDRITKKVKR